VSIIEEDTLVDRPTVSVVIATYTERRWDEMVLAVESVLRQEPPPDEILLIVDYNPELLARVQAELPVRAIANTHEKGLNGVRNTAIDEAVGDLVVYLDDDAQAEVGWLKEMVSLMALPGASGGGGKALPDWEVERPAWFPDEMLWMVGSWYKGHPDTRSEVRNVFGCSCIFRKDALVQMGGFRTGLGRTTGSLPISCEDTELCIRLRREVGPIYFAPEAIVYHKVHAFRTKPSYILKRAYAEGLSKALVTMHVGKDDALETERTYTFQVLPKGVLRGIGDAFHGDLSGLGRAITIIVGFSVTVLGYAIGRVIYRA